ncbi:MAG: ABC transporter ATP-binding protein [Candidatus Methylacidiphilales bacterium]
MALLELKQISQTFGNNHVLRDINLSVEQGEFVAIIGYSGSGKTTLMNLLSGLLRPSQGEALFQGRPINGPGPERGIVFQNYSLLPWLTVFENVHLAVAQVFPQLTAAEQTARVETFLKTVNLLHARDQKPAALSGGMRQRVSVARALAMDPKVLLLDEPLSALDALTRATLQDEIERIWETDRKTVVLITNDVDEGLLLADRIIPLTPGPGATLGPSIPVTLARPRDRQAVNHDPQFKALRLQVIDFLIGCKERATATVERKLVLPDIAPENLEHVKPWNRLFPGRGPRRLSEEHREVVEISA